MAFKATVTFVLDTDDFPTANYAAVDAALHIPATAFASIQEKVSVTLGSITLESVTAKVDSTPTPRQNPEHYSA